VLVSVRTVDPGLDAGDGAAEGKQLDRMRARQVRRIVEVERARPAGEPRAHRQRE